MAALTAPTFFKDLTRQYSIAVVALRRFVACPSSAGRQWANNTSESRTGIQLKR